MQRVPWVLGGIARRPAFHFPRFKIQVPTEIPRSVVYVLALGIVWLIFIGVSYDMVQKPESVGGQLEPELLYRGLDQQYLLEGVVAGTVMFGGAFGLYAMHYATSFSTDLRKSSTTLGVGVILVLVALVMILSMYNTKLQR